VSLPLSPIGMNAKHFDSGMAALIGMSEKAMKRKYNQANGRAA
jgi:hypothetical protein